MRQQTIDRITNKHSPDGSHYRGPPSRDGDSKRAAEKEAIALGRSRIPDEKQALALGRPKTVDEMKALALGRPRISDEEEALAPGRPRIPVMSRDFIDTHGVVGPRPPVFSEIRQINHKNIETSGNLRDIPHSNARMKEKPNHRNVMGMPNSKPKPDTKPKPKPDDRKARSHSPEKHGSDRHSRSHSPDHHRDGDRHGHRSRSRSHSPDRPSRDYEPNPSYYSDYDVIASQANILTVNQPDDKLREAFNAVAFVKDQCNEDYVKLCGTPYEISPYYLMLSQRRTQQASVAATPSIDQKPSFFTILSNSNFWGVPSEQGDGYADDDDYYGEGDGDVVVIDVEVVTSEPEPCGRGIGIDTVDENVMVDYQPRSWTGYDTFLGYGAQGDMCLYQQYDDLSGNCQQAIAGVERLHEHYQEEAYHHGPHLLPGLLAALVVVLLAKFCKRFMCNKQYKFQEQMKATLTAINNNQELKAHVEMTTGVAVPTVPKCAFASNQKGGKCRRFLCCVGRFVVVVLSWMMLVHVAGHVTHQIVEHSSLLVADENGNINVQQKLAVVAIFLSVLLAEFGAILLVVRGVKAYYFSRPSGDSNSPNTPNPESGSASGRIHQYFIYPTQRLLSSMQQRMQVHSSTGTSGQYSVLPADEDATEMVVASAPIMIHQPQQMPQQQYVMVPISTQGQPAAAYAQSLSSVSMI